MTDRHQELVLKLADIRKVIDAATLTPWRYEESRDVWSLHGEARNVQVKYKGVVITPGMQVLKAPKRNTPYAEYWPNAADSALIIQAVNMFPFWIDWAESVLKRHFPSLCSCSRTHFLCADNRAYEWEHCPEVQGLIRVLDKLHVGAEDDVVEAEQSSQEASR